MRRKRPLARPSIRRVVALTQKEFRQIVRDPTSVMIAFVFPIALLVLFGYGLSLDSTRARVGLVLEDTRAEARDFAAALARSPYVEMRGMATRAAAGDALRDEEISGFVVVPSHFSAQAERDGAAAAPLLLVTDGAEPSTAGAVEADVRGAYATWQAQRATRAGSSAPSSASSSTSATIRVEPRFWYNPAAVSRNYLVPGSITVIMTVIGALLTALVIAREWERGTMEALLSTPVTRTELLLSKFVPYYVVGQVALLLSVAFAVWVIGVPFRGSVFALLLVSTFFLGAALGTGLLLSTLMRNQFNAAQAALNVAFLPAMMLSGFVFEIDSMPWAVRIVTTIVPARYFVVALQTLFQVGTLWSVLLPQIAFLAAASIFFLGLTALKTRRTLE